MRDDCTAWKNRIKWGATTIILLTSCVDEIHFNVSSTQFQIVVDGMISDQPGPYTVKVSKSINLDADTLIREPIQNAKIQLFDDQGNEEDFAETNAGIYVTGGTIQGQIGHAYHIVITTADGKIFQSAPDLLSPVGQVDKISTEFEPRIVPTFFGEVSANVFNVFVDGEAIAGDNNFIRWRFTGTYQVLTYPELRMVLAEGYFYNDPPPCSGYIVTPALGGGHLEKVGDCTCCTCWITQVEKKPAVSDGQFIDHNEFKHVKVAEVPINNITFSDRYLVQIEQMSLSKAAFDFFRLIRAQADGTSSLFQPPSGQINGNIRAVNSSDPALGLFWATSVKTKTLFINKSDIPYVIDRPDSLLEACTFYLNSSTQKPLFWQ